MSKTCCTGSSGVIGLLACSGACYHAVLSKRCSIAAMGENQDRLHDICYIAPVLSLIYGDSIGIPAAKKQLRDFDRVVAIEGCRSDCATKLLRAFEYEPDVQIYLSEGVRADPMDPLTSEDDARIDASVPETVEMILGAIGGV